MNVEVLLYIPFVPHTHAAENNMPTLGACYIIGYLKRNGISVDIIDNYLEKNSGQEVCKKISMVDPEYLVVYIGSREMLLSFALSMHEYCLIYGKPSFWIICGGPYASVLYNNIHANLPFIDYVILGYGEQAVLDIMTHTKKKNRKLTNVSYMESGVVAADIMPKPSNLDSFGLPDYSYYFESFGKKLRYTISTSRGCYGKCSFCFVNQYYKNQIGKHSLGFVQDNVNQLKEYKLDSITFVDDNIFCNDNLINEEFPRFISDVGIKYSMSCRIENILDYKGFLRSISVTNLNHLFVGIESFSEEALKIFNKGITVDEITRALDVLKELGITCKFGFIFFHPWTTLQEIKTNISRLMWVLNSYPNVCPSVFVQDLDIHYKSSIYDRADHEGLLIDSGPFTNLTYRFKDPAVREIHKEWILENRKLLTNDYGSINELVIKQLILLGNIIENK